MLTATAVQNFEQTYTMYARIHLYCLIAAAAFLVLAIVLFFVLRIPQVFGELTGRTARKAVQEMKEGNPHSGELASAKKRAEHKTLTKSKGIVPMQRAKETETSVLTLTRLPQNETQSSENDFIVLRSIVELHTDEVI